MQKFPESFDTQKCLAFFRKKENADENIAKVQTKFLEKKE